MKKYKVGDVAALFSKPKDPTSESGKKLQSLFQDYYGKKKKSEFHYSQEETPELSARAVNKKTEDKSESKKNKKRKFSTLNDSELSNEIDSSKKFKIASEEEKHESFKRNEKKKDKSHKLDFPRKKKKGPKANACSTFPKFEVSDNFENDLESQVASKVKNSPKGNKQNVSFIKKSKHQNHASEINSSDAANDEYLNNEPNEDDISDVSLRKEIKEFMKSNSENTMKIKSSNTEVKQNSQRKVFKWEEQNGEKGQNQKLKKFPNNAFFDSSPSKNQAKVFKWKEQNFQKGQNQKSEKIVNNAFSGISPSENKSEFKNSPKPVPDFIRKPKRKTQTDSSKIVIDSEEKSVGISNKRSFNDSDTLFKSGSSKYVNSAEKFKKRKFSDKNIMQNSQKELPGQSLPDFIRVPNPNNDDNNNEDVLSRTLFVGNLSVNTSRKALKKLFSTFGEIDKIRFHGIETNRAKIFRENAPKSLNPNYAADSVPGFVVFKERASAVAALCLSGSMYGDRHITVDFALPTGSKKIYDNKRSIFIGNLPFGVKDENIWNTFQECGRIEGVRVVRDRETGLSKGFGYVLFTTIQSKENALALENVQIEGRIIRIKPVDSNTTTQNRTDSSPVKRNTFKSRAIKIKKNNKNTSSRKSVKKLMKKEKTLHKKKKIASILQKSMK